MESQKKSVLQSAMELGVGLGVILILLNIPSYYINLKGFNLWGSMLLGIIQLLACFFFVYSYTKKYRDVELNGFILFNQAFMYGFLLVFFSAIIFSFYLYILNKFIDTDLSRRSIDQYKEWFVTFMQNHGLSEDKIDETIKKLDANGIPDAAQIALNNIFSSSILGLILSLISAAILKKPANPFDAEKQNNDF